MPYTRSKRRSSNATRFSAAIARQGKIVSGVACMAEGHADSPEEIKAWMSGNICRCGVYPAIVAAVVQTAHRGVK
jgi:xanthine dehydrogenase YagT iron-sulfur-binding subunit